MFFSFRFILSVLIIGFVNIAFASPWIAVGDVRLKQHLHLLHDTGAINMSLSTWPIMWADVHQALEGVDYDSLDLAQKNALRELHFEERFHTKKAMKRSLELAVSSSRGLFRDFSAQEYEQGRISHVFDWDGESMSFKLQVNLTTDPGDDAVESQFYGSYLAGVLGEWLVGVGAIDRWWGAGHQASLILSNNAQPLPGVFLRTKQRQHFETPFLSWLGSWQFVSFLGQMEGNRLIPEAKLTGMRFIFQPYDRLEVGLSRAMQWGGDRRSESLSTFFKSVTSQGENTPDQAGNQLAGYDLRYNFLRKSTYGMGFYAQYIGEDEAGYLPARFLAQFGSEVNYAFSSGSALHAFLEYTNTTAGALQTDMPNVAYEHSLYETGYRYRGRTLGASYDNDAKVLAMGLNYYRLEGAQSMGMVLSKMNLNQDASQRGNTVSAGAVDLYQLKVFYQGFALGGQLKVSASYLSELPDLVKNDIDKFTVSLGLTYRF